MSFLLELNLVNIINMFVIWFVDIDSGWVSVCDGLGVRV